MQTRAIKLAWIAECGRHYEKSNLHYEGQRPVWRLRVTRSKRVAFLRRRKNAECINRGLRFPRALPWAMGNIWAFSPPQSFTGRLCKLVHLHASLAAARHNPSKLGLHARLAQTFVSNRGFLDIFGCARHSPNKFGSELALHKVVTCVSMGSI